MKTLRHKILSGKHRVMSLQSMLAFTGDGGLRRASRGSSSSKAPGAKKAMLVNCVATLP